MNFQISITSKKSQHITQIFTRAFASAQGPTLEKPSQILTVICQ